MIGALCEPCHAAGRLIKATHMSNPPTCDDHYVPPPKEGSSATVLARLAELRAENKGKLRAPPTTTEIAFVPVDEKEQAVTKRTKVDWIAAQNDRSDGMSVPEIAKKYEVSQASVYMRTKAAGSRKAGPGQGKRSPAAIAKPSHSNAIQNAIEELRIQRDKLDEAIRALELLS